MRWNLVVFYYLDYLKSDGVDQNEVVRIPFNSLILSLTIIFLLIRFGRNEEFALFRPRISNDGMKIFIPLRSFHRTKQSLRNFDWKNMSSFLQFLIYIKSVFITCSPCNQTHTNLSTCV